MDAFTRRIHGIAAIHDAKMRLWLRSLREPVLIFFSSRLHGVGWTEGGKQGAVLLRKATALQQRL